MTLVRRLALIAALVSIAQSAFSDRLVLAPRGLVAPPFSIGAEYAVHPYSPRMDIGWLTIGFPKEDLGLELELERSEVDSDSRETFHLQYTLTGNGVADFAPAVSVGIRDIMRSSRERQGLFAALTKNIGVPLAVEQTVQNLKVHLGIGTSAMGGLFGGAEARVRGFWLGAEYIAGNVNASIAYPIVPNLSVKAYTLDGDSFFGASFSLRR
jgi:hypothetical protein